jgi:hypothetical protein
MAMMILSREPRPTTTYGGYRRNCHSLLWFTHRDNTVNDKLVLYICPYANGYFGGSVAGAGDVNGDGYDDVLVGAKEYTIGASHQGVVFLYNGGSGGLNPSGLAITVNKADADFGFAVAGAGDVNRDGYADFVVGAPTSSASGSISIYLGGMPMALPQSNVPSMASSLDYTTLLYVIVSILRRRRQR